MILPIRLLGDTVLRTTCKRVASVTSAETQNLIKELIETAHSCDSAAGLAAPQIGFDDNAFVMATHLDQDGEQNEGEAVGYKVVINPKFLFMSDEMENGVESCFSIPDQVAVVERHTAIKVRYEDEKGEEQEEEMEGYNARIFQHEYDHLMGVLFLDRVTDKSNIMTEQEYIDFIEDSEEVLNNPDLVSQEGMESINTDKLKFNLEELDAMLEKMSPEERENLVEMVMETQAEGAKKIADDKKVLLEKYNDMKKMERKLGISKGEKDQK